MLISELQLPQELFSIKEGQRNRYCYTVIDYFGRCGAFVHCYTVSVTQWYASNILHKDNSKVRGYGRSYYFSAIICMHSICVSLAIVLFACKN